MASIRDKLQRLHAPRPTELPVATPSAAAPAEEPAAKPKSASLSGSPSAPATPPQKEARRPAARASVEPPDPLPAAHSDKIAALRSRLDRVFNPSMKAAAKKAEALLEAEVGRPQAGRREVTVAATDEAVMRPRKAASSERSAASATKRKAKAAPAEATRTFEPDEEAAPPRKRAPLRLEPVAAEQAPAPPVRPALSRLPMPVASEGLPTADTRHRWQGLRTEVMQARATNDEAAALALLAEMAALPSTDAWPHVELARYYETVAHDYERALAHIRIALSRAGWNGGYKSQLARLESKLRRS